MASLIPYLSVFGDRGWFLLVSFLFPPSFKGTFNLRKTISETFGTRGVNQDLEDELVKGESFGSSL